MMLNLITGCAALCLAYLLLIMILLLSAIVADIYDSMVGDKKFRVAVIYIVAGVTATFAAVYLIHGLGSVIRFYLGV